MVSIETIEASYKRKYETKKINKKTKKWKKFYRDYRKKAKDASPLVKAMVKHYEAKPKKESKKQSNSMTFNGKRYSRSKYRTYSTKEEAKKEAKKYRKNNVNTIIDKRKDGYFFWIRNK